MTGDDGTPAVTAIGFEAGLRRLEEIASELDRPDLPLDRTVELLREGKGLERALRGFLETAEGELREIEEGRNLPAFRIAPAAEGSDGAP